MFYHWVLLKMEIMDGQGVSCKLTPK